jgi:hypothetical protein
MKDIINIIAVIVGPIVAVCITLWYQDRKEKRDAKIRLFTMLMAHRKSNPPTFELVNGLNLIDVVFSQHRKIVDLWHEYYDMLSQKPINWQIAESKYLDLLANMARDLGYKNLLQTDISRYYSPVAHGNQFEINDKIQTEWLRVLENTGSFVVNEREDATPQKKV